MPDLSETPTAQELVEPITYWLNRAEQRGAHPSQVGIAREYLAVLQARAEQADRLRERVEELEGVLRAVNEGVDLRVASEKKQRYALCPRCGMPEICDEPDCPASEETQP